MNYISVIQNPLYRNILKTCERDIIHTMGAKEKIKQCLQDMNLKNN